MITVKKGEMRTTILETFKDKYVSAGWEVVDTEPTPSANEDAAIIADAINSKQSARSRKRTPVADSTTEANAIAATELKKPPAKEFTDGLIKDEE